MLLILGDVSVFSSVQSKKGEGIVPALHCVRNDWVLQEHQQLQAQQLMPGGQLSPQLSDIALQQQLASQYGLPSFAGTAPSHRNRPVELCMRDNMRLLEGCRSMRRSPLSW